MPPDIDQEGQLDGSTKDEISVQSLLDECRNLLKELDSFEAAYTAAQGQNNVNDIRPLRNAVASELKSLERLTPHPSTPRTTHTLRSSNLPFLSAVWRTAYSLTSITGFQKRFYWSSPGSSNRASTRTRKPKKRSALVDIVASSGALWVKVSTISAPRLLFSLAKAGWDAGSGSDEGEGADWDGGKVSALAGAGGVPEPAPGGGEGEGEGDGAESEDDRVELVRIAEDLGRAARGVRVGYRHPRVRVVVPKLREGESPEVDGVLKEIRALGVEVWCGTVGSEGEEGGGKGERELDRLLPALHPPLTDTLNLDCTILLALASDLSHESHTPEPSFHASIQRQITLEMASPLLSTSLYPAFAGRELVAAPEAVKRMKEIVAQIGTTNEKLRAAIMLGESEGAGLNEAERREAWGKTSIHEVPGRLRLPIKTVKDDIKAEELPEVVERIEEEVGLSEVNRGTLWLGWKNGWVTVSSNRVVVRGVEKVVETWLDEKEEKGEDDEYAGEGLNGLSPGPVVWICGVARSLIGKDSGRG